MKQKELVEKNSYRKLDTGDGLISECANVKNSLTRNINIATILKRVERSKY